MKLQKTVTMDIIASPFNEHSNKRVYEDVHHVLVNIWDDSELNDRNFRALCAHPYLFHMMMLTKRVLRFPLV